MEATGRQSRAKLRTARLPESERRRSSIGGGRLTAEKIFDRSVVRRHRDRAANLGRAEFLYEHAARDLVERLCSINRTFDTALILGSRRGEAAQILRQSGFEGSLFQSDFSLRMAQESQLNQSTAPVVVFDEELVPIAEHSVDLILSPLTLHWLNDLPGALIQLCRALRPDGLILASLFGGSTLAGLRDTMLKTELDLENGASQRISPVLDLRDAAGLLQRAGFALPVADTETVEVTYESCMGLLADLRAMGETSALMRRDRRTPPRAFWPMVVDRYDKTLAGPDGRVRGEFEIITLTGWRPHENQQKALRPGSATSSLAARLGAIEHGTGEKPG